MTDIMNVLNNKIDNLTISIHDDIMDVLTNGDPDATNTFIIAGSLANVVGWYCSLLNEISPELKDKFKDMIQSRIALNAQLH